MIVAKNISIGYSKYKELYSNMNIEIEAGSFCCILGLNGAGKSTLLRSLSVNQKLLAGEISIDKKNIKTYSPAELSKTISLVLTDKTQAGGLRVEEIISLGRYPYIGFFGRLQERDKKIVVAAMQEVGIADKKNNFYSDLSDGEKQKVIIAKALAQDTPIILLDEPTSFLDISSRIEIMLLLKKLSKEGKTILMSTHNIEQALGFADELILLDAEKGLVIGSTQKLISENKINDFFDTELIHFNKESCCFDIKGC